MKKTIIGILAVLLLSVAVVTLFAVSGNKNAVDYPATSDSAAITFTQDNTVLPEFIYNSSVIADSSVYTIRSWDNNFLQEDEADCVVLGTVIDTFYTFIDGSAWTQANIRVDEVSRGKLSEGDVISVYFPDGYALVDDYVAFYSLPDSGFPGVDFIEFTVNDRPHPQPGDNDVFCLEKLSASSPLPDGAYAWLNVVIEDEAEETDEELETPEIADQTE